MLLVHSNNTLSLIQHVEKIRVLGTSPREYQQA